MSKQEEYTAGDPKFFLDPNREQPIDIVILGDCVGIKAGQITMVLRLSDWQEKQGN